MQILGRSQPIALLDVKIYLFLKGFDLFLWSIGVSVRSDVSVVRERGEGKGTNGTRLLSISL